MKLSGKTIVISGAASGLGREVASYCVHKKNARVVLLDTNAVAGAECARALGADWARFIATDIVDPVQTAEAVKQAVEWTGAVHACYSFAGVVGPMRILDKQGEAGSAEAFARTVSVNLIGTYNLISHCAAAMSHNEPSEDGERGVLVTIASGAAFDGQVGQSAYAASKAGLVGLSLPAARELAPHGIRVNCIAPGAFYTPMLESLPSTVVQRITEQFQFPKRFGHPHEIASLCAYITENAYINGECIRLDAAFRLPPR